MSAGTPVIFDDGSKAFVPAEKLSAAIRDGGKVAQFMHFDDRSKAYVPLDKVHDAIHDGGQLMGAPPQAPRIPMQEQPLTGIEKTGLQVGGDLSRYASEAAPSVVGAGKNLATQIYDVSAPNIANQVYRHVRGLPNNLKDIPSKAVLAFMAAGGLGEEGLADTTAKPEAVSTKGAEATQTAAAVPAPSGEAIPQPASTAPAEPVDPLLTRLQKIAADIEAKEAAEAAKQAAKRGRIKIPTEPVVPASDAEMFRLLKQSLAQAEQRNATVQ